MEAISNHGKRNLIAILALVAVFVWRPVLPAQSSGVPEEWKKTEEAMGRTGLMQAGDVIRFGMPRSDLHVMVQGVAVKPALALGSWAAFKSTGGGDAMVMGDLVLAEDEVEPVMKKLADSGIQIAAVHNHLIGESPRVMYLHIASHGDAVKMAQAIRGALEVTKTPAPAQGGPASSELVGFDQKKVEAVLGYSGKVNGGVLQVGVPRSETITEGAMVVPPAMGVATALNFQPTGGGKAAVTGDFVLLGTEVNPVLKALRGHGIQVTAVHSHMLEEAPRLFFVHFWANEDAVKLAQGLRAALDATNSKKP
jgi:biotin operon repressor